MNLLLNVGKLLKNPLSAAHMGLVVQTSPVQLKHEARGGFDIFFVLKLTVAKLAMSGFAHFFGNWEEGSISYCT